MFVKYTNCEDFLKNIKLGDICLIKFHSFLDKFVLLKLNNKCEGQVFLLQREYKIPPILIKNYRFMSGFNSDLDENIEFYILR